MIDRNQVHEGMLVHASNGQKLGRVLSCAEWSFVIEKGRFFVTDYAARYDDVAVISADTIQLSRSRQELVQTELAHALGDEGAVVWPSYGDEGGGGLL